MASAWAVGLSTDDEGAVQGMLDPLRLKAPLNQSSPPTPWAPAQGTPQLVLPDFSNLAIFGVDADVVGVDAHTTGSDLIPWPDASGAPAVDAQNDNWLMYIVSVTDSSEGTGDGHIASLQNVRPVGAELISFYASGSQNLDPSLPGSTRVEGTALSLGYDGTANGTEDVDALDYSIGVHTFSAPNPRSQMLFPSFTRYYFSVTPQTMTEWSNKYQQAPKVFAMDGMTPMYVPRPGDVYLKTWTGSSWGPTELFRDGADLGLFPWVDDIDALAINRYNGVTVFSTVLDPTDPNPPAQLRINTGTAASTQTLRDKRPNGGYDRVEDQLDLGGEKDDIDGLCGIDPEGGQHYDRMAGITVTSVEKARILPDGTEMLDISMERGYNVAGGTEHIMVQVGDWAGHAPQDCDMVVFLYENQYPLLPDRNPFAPFQPLANQGITVTPAWTALAPLPRFANQEQWELPVPFAVPANTPERHMAVFVAMFSKQDAGGGLLTCSRVTQFQW